MSALTDNERLVLVVDDKEIKRYTTCRTLEHAGMSVCEVANGEDALRVARELLPAVVVLDIRLPDIDGFEVCRRLKEDPETSSILVMHFSAHETAAAEKVRGLQAGADAYLTLPVESEVLVGTVEALLRQHRAEEMARRIAHHWQATFHAIGDAIVLVDAEGRVQEVNRALELLVERPNGILVGKPAAELFDVILGFKVTEVDLPVPPRETLTEAHVRELRAVDGRYLRITIDPILTKPRGFEGVVVILTDISAEKRRELQRDAEYAREKRIAETLQRAMLTPLMADAFPSLMVEPIYVPAWNEALVGGDFYDAFALGNGRIALIVADASGKGLAAAARTAEVKHTLRAFLWENPDPADAVRRVNDFICHAQDEDHRNGFVTLALVTLDPQTGDATVAVAGAEPPLLIRRAIASNQGDTVDEAVPIVAQGLPLGVEANAAYKTVTLCLAPGETIVLATDGITEARKGRSFFGYERMAESALRVAPGEPLRVMGDAILGDARRFANGSLQDDVCLLLARRG